MAFIVVDATNNVLEIIHPHMGRKARGTNIKGANKYI